MTDRSTPSTDDGTGTADEALDPTAQRRAVRDRYGRIASESASCCDGRETESPSDGKQPSTDGSSVDRTRRLGYASDDVKAVDAAADMSLGCGNPTALAALEEGDTVLDLGSGGGFDCFLAAREVGPTGRVVGVDMTPEMVETARENAAANDAGNVEFRLAEIEHLPVADRSVDVVLSNCVVNLSPDKPQVFREAYRVLRPGGRLAVSDVVRTAGVPSEVRADPDSVAGCVAGAASIPALDAMLTDAGFADVSIEPKEESREFIREWDDDRDPSDYVVAATIEAERPTEDS